MLSDHDPLRVVRVWARSEVGLERGGAGLLQLEEERILHIAVGHEKKDRAGGSHAADPHDLLGNVDDVVSVEQGAPFVRQRREVPIEEGA